MAEFNLSVGSENLNVAVGLVGHGRWGRRHLATLLQLKAEGRISNLYVCDIDPDQLQLLPEGVNGVFTSLTNMLEEVSMNILAIATPPETHIPLATQASKMGIHLLVEKPLGTDYDETIAFLDALPATINLTVGYLLRHHSGIMVMRGHVLAEDAKPLNQFHYKRRTKRSRPRGATPLETLAIHALDLCPLLLKSPLAAFSVSVLTITRDSAYIEMEGEGGQHAIIDVAWGAQEEVRQLILSGGGEELQLDFGTNNLVHRQPGIQHAAAVVLGNEQPLYQEWRHLLASVKNTSGFLLPTRNELLDQALWLANHR